MSGLAPGVPTSAVVFVVQHVLTNPTFSLHYAWAALLQIDRCACQVVSDLTLMSAACCRIN